MTKHNNDKPEYQNRPATRDLPAGDKYVPQKGSVSYADVILDGGRWLREQSAARQQAQPPGQMTWP